jgi:hypothetical protein
MFFVVCFKGYVSLKNFTIQKILLPSFVKTGDIKLNFKFCDKLDRSFIQGTILLEAKGRSLT